MNWTEVSVMGAASAFPMSGRGMGGGRAGVENSRPLPGTIHPASGGDCRTVYILNNAAQEAIWSN